MSVKVKVTIKGYEELNRKLSLLPTKKAKEAFRKASREAMKPLKNAVQTNLPLGETGYLKSNVKVKSTQRSRKHFGAMVQARGFYWNFWERGHVRRFGHGVSGSRTKIQDRPPAYRYKGQWIMRNTALRMKSHVIQNARIRLGMEITRLMKQK